MRCPHDEQQCEHPRCLKPGPAFDDRCVALNPPKAPQTFAPIPGVLVLGLGHKARHGKDTVAQAMLESSPADVLRIGFADALYDYCRVEHGMTTKDAPLLQRVGVQMREERDPQVWIKAVYYKILDKRPKVVVIPDVRFTNEAEFVKALGGYTIKVERRVRVDLGEDKLYLTSDRDPNHVSETQLDGYSWDLTIINRDRDIITTREHARQVLGFFRQKHMLEAVHG